MAGRLRLEDITDGLTTRRVGRRIEIHETVDCTNRLAWDRVAGGECDGLAIFAEYQLAGRGRFGRRWESPRGASVMMSVALVDADGRLGDAPGALGLLSAVAAVDAMAAAGVVAEIKWPNDLVVGGRKLGGVLVESRLCPRAALRVPHACPRRPGRRAYVVGIGINCLQHRDHFPEALKASATSLDLETTQPVHRAQVARDLIVELDRWLAEPQRWDAQALRDAWVRRALPLGRRVRLRQAGEEFSGQVLDVDPSAGLVVQLDRGGRRLFDASNTSAVDDA